MSDAVGKTLAATAAPASAHPLAPLFDPATIRARCAAVLRSVQLDLSPSFTLDLSRLDAVAERVATLTRRRFPDLVIPLHSRWRHFEAGGVDRRAELEAALATHDVAERDRARVDLTVVSVLLDAGAGPRWHYDEAASGQRFVRSEGLGVASFRAFMDGAFAVTTSDPLRVDAAALQRIDADALRARLQSRPDNPLLGLEGRAALLQRLGRVLQDEATRSGHQARPGLLLDRLRAAGAPQVAGAAGAGITAAALLGEVLRTLAPVWPSGSRVQGLPAGDVWPHRWAGAAIGGGGSDRTTEGWVPFHKLSQWLSYSLLEPLQWAGLQVTGLHTLTGLPEYRNGGLLLDAGVIVPRSPALLARSWSPRDELVVEWRALTVALLDEVAERVRRLLGRSADDLPLACILEGGTWAAGREIARERRPDGAPPLRIDSDGTLF